MTPSRTAIRRKRLLYQARHRGFKEADIVLGAFAEVELAAMSVEDLEAFERLLDYPDRDIYAWVAEGAPAPDAVRGAVFDRLRDFSRSGAAVRS